MKRACLLGVLTLIGCGVNLKPLDALVHAPLAADPSFVNLAPREPSVIAAKGGVPPYQFVFAEGSPLSGADAQLDPTTGAYRAGSAGSAQDSVVITDSVQAKTTAVINVGAKLSVTPKEATVAPLGSYAFVVSGGKPPYVFNLQKQDDNGSSVDGAGKYAAGQHGSRDENLIVTDATNDAQATTTAIVHIGAELVAFPVGVIVVAPNEALDFLAFGGQPPYTFALANAGAGSQGRIDAQSGEYLAGVIGDSVDSVQVSDANGALLVREVSVGAALNAHLSASANPANASSIVVSGGRAPYRFAFAAKGNRSHGTIEPVTGLYTPGVNAQVSDWLEVFDATQPPVSLKVRADVGNWLLPVGNASRCLSGDLNADGFDDIIVSGVSADSPQPQISTAVFDWSDGHLTTSRYQGANSVDKTLSELAVGDFNSDGHADLALAYTSGVKYLLSDPAGRLSTGITAFQSLWLSDARPLLWAAPGPLGSQLFTTFESPLLGTGVLCSSPVGGATAGVARIDWAIGSPQPSAPVCLMQYTIAQAPAVMAVGDFNHDGSTGDLAFIRKDTPLTLRASYAPSYSIAGTTTASLPYQPFSTYPSAFGVSPPPLFAVLDADGNGGDDLIFEEANGFDDEPAWWVNGATGPTLSSCPPAACPGPVCPSYCTSPPFFSIPHTYSPYRPHPASAQQVLASVLSLAAPLYRYGYQAGAPAVYSVPATPGYTFDCASTPDVNGDRVPDLLMASKSRPFAELMWGDGDGGFGRSRHFFGPGLSHCADVDGDGLLDVIRATRSPSLAVMYGSEGQLAYGEETALTDSPRAFTVGDFGTSATDVVVLQPDNSLTLLTASTGVTRFLQQGSLVDATTGIRLSEANLVPGTLEHGDFGGAASGLDLYGWQGGNINALLLVRSSQLAANTLSQSAGSSANCALQAVDLDLSAPARDDIAYVCEIIADSSTRVYRSLVGPTGPALSVPAQLGAILPSGGVASDSKRVAKIGRDGNRAVFVAPGTSANSTRLITVSNTGGSTSGYSVQALAYVVTSGALGLLGADGNADLALVDSLQRLHVLDGDGAGTYTERPAGPVCVAGEVAAVGAMSSAGVADIVLRTAVDFVILPNQGASGFVGACP